MKTADDTNLFSVGPIQLTAEDLANAARLNLRQAIFARKFLFRFVAIILVAGLISCIFYYHAIARTLPLGVVFMIGAVGTATFVLTLSGLTYLSASRQTRKIFKQQKNLHQPYTLNWNDSRLELTSEVGNARFSWNDFLKIREDSQNILLYESENLYRLIPKRFLTEDQIISLRQRRLAGHD
ncbi:YcxB family protein [Brucella sp. BE17]|uniref:YcxB family protein n=1 Tax=Brucella sp. BE17 TaxID=3142977 RepID=UPI0031BA1311